MRKNNLWAVRLNTAALVLIPAAVGINYIGKFFAATLKLPLWLDSIGTVLASMLAGPIVGALSGAINNLIYGFTADFNSAFYAITSVAIGLTVGILAKTRWLNSWWNAFLTGIIVALVSAIVSTPINIKLWGGMTGNVWGDALYTYLAAQNTAVWLASFLDEFVVDFFDKVAVVLIAYGMVKGLPKSLVALYSDDHQIEKL